MNDLRRVRVKICGLTCFSDVRAAVSAGADALGFVLAESPRQVSASEAERLRAAIPAFVTTVAVFRHPTAAAVDEALADFHPDVVQTEIADEIIDAVDGRARVLPVLHDTPDLVDHVIEHRIRYQAGALLEAPGRGGRGVAPDWTRAESIARLVPLVLAGGLNAENVAEAIRAVHPFGVDVSTGVEVSPGCKDAGKLNDFCTAVRQTPVEVA